MIMDNWALQLVIIMEKNLRRSVVNIYWALTICQGWHYPLELPHMIYEVYVVWSLSFINEEVEAHRGQTAMATISLPDGESSLVNDVSDATGPTALKSWFPLPRESATSHCPLNRVPEHQNPRLSMQTGVCEERWPQALMWSLSTQRRAEGQGSPRGAIT